MEAQYKIGTVLLPDRPGYWKFGLKLQLAKEIAPQDDNIYLIDFIVPIAVGKSITSVDGINYFVVVAINKTHSDSFTVTENDKFEEVSDCIYQRIANKLNAEIHWSMEQQQGQSKYFYLDS